MAKDDSMSSSEDSSCSETKGPYCICQSYDDSRFMICCDRCNQWFHGDCIGVESKEAKGILCFYCPVCRAKNSELEIVYKNERTSGSHGASSKKKLKRKRRHKIACGRCIGCFHTEDCGECDNCKDMKKFGGPGKLHLKCRLRQCVGIGYVTSDDDDDESSKAGVAKESFSENYVKKESSSKMKNLSRHTSSKKRKFSRQPSENTSVYSHSGLESSRTRASSRKYQEFMKEAGVENAGTDEYPKGGRQCYGPQCVYAARPGSNYCSDECGLKLARRRILEILPGRIQSWNATPSMAERFERHRLDVVHKKAEEAKQRLAALDLEEKRLSEWISETAKLKANPEEEANDKNHSNGDSEAEDAEINIYCVSCGHEISARCAIKHMSKCFARCENQTSYGTTFRATNTLYNLFCEAYNKSNGTYCKRLRVICPEHCKDVKAEPNEICGCPLNLGDTLEVFSASAACQVAKRNCTKHCQWEKIRRGLIDQDRLTQLLRLDELYEEERFLKAAIFSRGDLMSLLLHQTVQHEQSDMGMVTESVAS